MQAPNHLINIAKDTLISLNEFAAVPGVYGSVGKESACHAGDPGSIPGSGRFPWRRARQPTPVSLLEKPLTEEPGRLHTVHGVAKSQT